MAMYHRVGFTAAQSAELWERWKKGEGLKSIGRAFGKPSSCIFAHLRPSGGIMPPARRRSRLALTMAEREEISRGIVEGQSVRAIARMPCDPKCSHEQDQGCHQSDRRPFVIDQPTDQETKKLHRESSQHIDDHERQCLHGLYSPKQWPPPLAIRY